MSIFSKVFGKKKTVDTANQAAHQQQQQQQQPPQGPNEQANAFDGFEIVNDVIPDGAPVADVYLNVDTESKSRSHMTAKELFWDNNVGHTWLTIKPINGHLPEDLNAMVQPVTRNLVEAHGETPIGFWPLTVRHNRTEGKKLSAEKARSNAEDNARLKAEIAIRQAKGFTDGSGTITREQVPEHDLHCSYIGKDTEGRVEEPDDTHTPKGRKVYRITRKQFREMYRYIDAHRNHKYNLLTYNCTTFASHALKAAGQNVAMEGMTMPTSLYEAMYKEAKSHAKAAEKAKKQHKKIGKSSVELLKLAEGEAHRKTGKSKEGPNGKDVRVPGVEKFDLPMFTDPAEITLKKVIETDKVTEDDKSLFVQAMFVLAAKRTLDGVKALTEEAFKHDLLTKREMEDVMSFYMKDYHLIKNPRVITENPDVFADYMMIICNVSPQPKVVSMMFDGKTISPEHDLNKLCQRVIWNALLCDKFGEEFLAHVLPLNFIAFMDGMTTVMPDSFKLAMKHFMGQRKRRDLNHVMIMMSKVFVNNENLRDTVEAYYKDYFNYKIKHFMLTDEDYADAQAFAEQTELPIAVQSLPKIQRELEISKQRRFYGTMSSDNKKISTLPKKYVKAKKPKNAPKPDENEIVAEVYLNVDTQEVKDEQQAVSRTKLNTDSVGHTWLTIKPTKQGNEQQGSLPVDLEHEIQGSATGRNTVNIIRAKGETAMGLWPLQNGFVRTDSQDYQQNTSEEQKKKDAKNNIDRQARQDVRDYKGFTKGAGDVSRDQTQYHGYSWHNVGGRVEEPDDNHTPKARKRYVITRKQFKKMYRYIEAHRNHFYHILTYNCTTFATHALHEAGQKASGKKGGVCYPARLYRELYDEAKSDARHQRASKVQLLKLAKNESHGEHVQGKIGETGENVRVKGVEKFDMVERYSDEAEVIVRKFQLDPGQKTMYARMLADSLAQNTDKRTTNDAIRIADEALRINLLSPEIVASVKTIYQNYKGMLEDIQRFKALPIAQQYDFIKAVELLADFSGVKKIIYPITSNCTGIAVKVLESPVGSPEYEMGIKLCSELITGVWENEFDLALEQVQVSQDLMNKLFELDVKDIYSNVKCITNTILKLNDQNPELAFNYLLEFYRNPQTSDVLRDKLVNPLTYLTSMLPAPDAVIPSLNELKDKGLIPKDTVDYIMKSIQQRLAMMKAGKA